MHSSGWMYSISAVSNVGSSLRGWMQSTGHTSTQAASLVPTHGSQMIYAKVISGQPRKYNSERRAGRFAAAVWTVAVAASLHAAQSWRDAPELMLLFAPEGPRSAAYHMRVADADLETVMRELDGDAAGASVPRPWDVRAVAPTDAFGKTGRYDRSRLTRLYGARRARVARRARIENGRVVESWSLISPYPDATLQTLHPGTLLIVLRLP